jgi:hypothetical protein
MVTDDGFLALEVLGIGSEANVGTRGALVGMKLF